MVRRIVREEKDLYCLADVGAIICGKAIKYAGQDVKRTIARFPELVTKCDQFPIAVDRRQPLLMRFGRPVVVIAVCCQRQRCDVQSGFVAAALARACFIVLTSAPEDGSAFSDSL